MALNLFHCGPWSLLFETTDGAVRHLRWHDREVLRGIYAAVRDCDWGTVKPQLHDLQIFQTDARMRFSFAVDCISMPIDFAWRGEIEFESNGRLRYSFRGKARHTFRRNRVGLCVLHPPECAGQPCRIETGEGGSKIAEFPKTISPHQPFFDLRSISHEPAMGVAVRVLLEGDTFEMEDQRNWTDASFKTYCTPLALPFPAEVLVGTEIQQAITVSVAGRPLENLEYSVVQIDHSSSIAESLPAVGFGVADGEGPLTTEAARLRELRPAHLRVDLNFAKPDWRKAWDRALQEAETLEAPLEVGLKFTESTRAELSALINFLEHKNLARVIRWLIFHRAEKVTSSSTIAAARSALSPLTREACFVGGTDAYFAELNRVRPMVEPGDEISFSINPQVHAFDDLSLVETLAVQGSAVRAATEFCSGHPVRVSPITLRPRFNPNAADSQAAIGLRESSETIDPRQKSIFNALWTLGSFKHLAEAGTCGLTFFRTRGDHGLVDSSGEIFPVWQVFRSLADFSGGTFLPMISSAPLVAEALLLANEDHRRLLLAWFAVLPSHEKGKILLPIPGDAAVTVLAGHFPGLNRGPLGEWTILGSSLLQFDYTERSLPS